MAYTFEDYRRYLDDLHEDRIASDREEADELEAYFREKDPFLYSIEEADVNAALLKEVDSWFEPEQADLDAAFEYDLWLSGAE